MISYGNKTVDLPMENIESAEKAGFDSVWFAEAYGADAISQIAWVLAKTKTLKAGSAIMQVPGRTPAAAAMTAMSLAHLSSDRFILGLGASGPQVVEGWHGVGYKRPLQRLREYIDIVRLMMKRESPVSYDGDIYQLPYQGEGSVGLGKPLKSILAAKDTPIYTASFTPEGFRLSGELAEGALLAFASPEKLRHIAGYVEEGFAKSTVNKGWANFDLAPFVNVCCDDDIDVARDKTRKMLALYIGGMGSKKKNFYNDMVVALGYEEAAKKIQALYLAGDKSAAEAAVPNELIDEVSLSGTKEAIKKQAQKWKAAERAGYIKTMVLSIDQPEMIEYMAEIFSQ
jgi:F420-dependent oxidoreductase-like protein